MIVHQKVISMSVRSNHCRQQKSVSGLTGFGKQIFKNFWWDGKQFS